MLDLSNGRQSQRFGAGGPTRYPANGELIYEQPRLRHADGYYWKDRQIGTVCINGLEHLVAPRFRVLRLRIAMNNDEVEGLVKAKNRFKTVGNAKSGRWIQAPQIRSNDVQIAAVARCDAGNVQPERLI